MRKSWILPFTFVYAPFLLMGAQWLSGRVLNSRLRVRASRARHIYPSLVLVQPRKTRPCLTERLLMGRKESNQTNISLEPFKALQTQGHGVYHYFVSAPYFLKPLKNFIKLHSNVPRSELAYKINDSAMQTHSQGHTLRSIYPSISCPLLTCTT